MGRGQPNGQAKFLARVFLAVAGLLSVAGLDTVAQTPAPGPQVRLTVATNAVLVPVFVYDPARMPQALEEEMPCARALVVTFFKLAPGAVFAEGLRRDGSSSTHNRGFSPL